MLRTRIELGPLGPALHSEATSILGEAFRDDPTLGWCFEQERPGFEARLRAYLELGHRWHVGRGEPVHGAFAGGALAGVVYLMRPDAESPRDALAAFERSLEGACGAEGAARFARYNQAMEGLHPVACCHVLALVGVRSRLRGRGLGSALVRWVGAQCDGDPRSQGVVLDTGRERNLAFYGRLGYRSVGTARLGPLVEHLLFRPREAPDPTPLGGPGGASP